MSDTPRIGANISTLFRELPLLERFAVAGEHGFDGVEIQFPYAESPAALARAAEAARMPVMLINAPVAPPAQPYGIAARPELKPLFRTQLAQLEEYAAALRPRFVHVLAGQVSSGTERRRCLEAYEENLALAVAVLRPKGIEVLIEPLNPLDVPGYFLDSFDLARSILGQGPPGLGMQFDVYHAARMGLVPAEALTRALPQVRHVQFADAPGRHEPGSGGVQFDAVLSTLLDAGYTGWLGAEYFPTGPTGRSLGWLAEWRAWMRGHGARPPA